MRWYLIQALILLGIAAGVVLVCIGAYLLFQLLLGHALGAVY